MRSLGEADPGVLPPAWRWFWMCTNACAPCACQIAVTKEIIAKEGFGGLYRGLSAGLLRQATYTTARLGIFNNLSIYLKKANDGKVRDACTVHPSVCVPVHPLISPVGNSFLCRQALGRRSKVG